MTHGSWALAHSMLSPYLNLGLFEALNAVLDAIVDALVITGLEMQSVVLAAAPPVTAV